MQKIMIVMMKRRKRRRKKRKWRSFDFGGEGSWLVFLFMANAVYSENSIPINFPNLENATSFIFGNQHIYM
jgi:hypothetical protein